MAGLYAFLSADFVAVIQLLVYVGGILVLILFAVMLTARIDDARRSRTRRSASCRGSACSSRSPGTMALRRDPRLRHTRSRWRRPSRPTAQIGNALLGDYVLPFEVVSILLLAVLLGAVTLARGRQPGDEE